jgi:hypothetical protein
LVVGGYIAYTLEPYLGFWGALIASPFLTAIIGLAVEKTLISRVYGRDPLYSLLLTFGLAFILEDGTRVIWGANGVPFTIPAALAQPLSNQFFFITSSCSSRGTHESLVNSWKENKGHMSALGQKQTSRHFQSMSALPPKADIGTQSRNVR